MIFDVETGERSAFDRDFDVCVIGAGPAGITLARRLAARGFDVALMEGGGLEWSEESQAIAVGESVGLVYPDLDVVRVRCFGGSSGHWNGLCRAFEAADMRPRPQNPGERLADQPRRSRSLPGRSRRNPRPRPGGRRRPARNSRSAAGRLPAGLVPAQRPDPLRREVPRRDPRRRADRARRPREPRRPPARRPPRPASPGQSSAATPPTIPASPSGRAPTASAPAASRTRGCCSTSPARSRKASATRTTWWAGTSAITCACRSAR